MSLEAATSKLSSPIKDLVQSASHPDQLSDLAGQSESEQKEVIQWLDQVSSGAVPKPDHLQELEAQLTPKTFVVGNQLTIADIALFGALHPIISQLQPQQYYAFPSLTRYFDHIQSLSAVRKPSDALNLSLVHFDLENTPPLTRTVDPPKKKVAKAGEDSNQTTAKAEQASGEQKKQEKKKEKEKTKQPTTQQGDEKKKKGAPQKAAPADDEGPWPSMIDLRVGHIVDVMKHPGADSLYVEQIDLGEETGPRTVVSGLVNYVPIEQMRDKWLVAVCNLKPANMRGVKSFAMVLCATSKDGKEAGIEIIQPPPNSKPGDRVYFEGTEFENATPLAQLNPKKGIFEAIQPGFTTLDSKEAAWINPETKSIHRIRTKEGVCVAPTLVGASLS